MAAAPASAGIKGGTIGAANGPTYVYTWTTWSTDFHWVTADLGTCPSTAAYCSRSNASANYSFGSSRTSGVCVSKLRWWPGNESAQSADCVIA